MKFCYRCESLHSAIEFHRDRSRKDGVQAYCKSCQEIQRVKRWSENREQELDNKRQWQAKNAEHCAEYNRQWADKNRERKRQNHKEYQRQLRRDPAHRLHQRISRGMRKSLSRLGMRKGGESWEKMLGYDRLELKAHLERQFRPGMTWDNMGDWHIDHIIPLASFDADDIAAAWSITNLRPLWASENVKKHARRTLLI